MDRTVWKWTCELELHVGPGRAALEHLWEYAMLHRTPRGPLVRLRYTQDCRPSDVGGGQWECAEHVAYPVGLGALRYRCHESVICYLDVDQDRTSWGKSDYGAFRRVSAVSEEEKKRKN